jgi:osmoprotectant transport system ATP-binding protein
MMRGVPQTGEGIAPVDEPAHGSPAIVQFRDVEFRHGDGPAVVRGVSLACSPGEVIALVGRSGAGKSTLLRLVNRLLVPASGTVEVQGRDTREWDPVRLRRSIGYVLQDAALFPHMTVEENVGVVPRLEGWEPSRISARVHELLELVGLPAAAFASRRPAALSGGQRQRVGLARALAVDPPILLMDEPFGALDAITRAEVRNEFALVQRRLRTTVLIVTHDIAEASVLAHRIAVMDAGQLIAVDTPGRLVESGVPEVSSLVASAQLMPGRRG